MNTSLCDKEVSCTSEPASVAVVGCGAIAQQLHLPVLVGHEGVQLRALVDRDVKRARELARAYGVEQVLADAAELAPESVDGVVVATPPTHHAACSIALMKRGIHVLVEKPMATTYCDAREMVSIAKQAGVVLSVGLFRRLYPSIRMLKALLESQWLGRPVAFEARWGGFYDWSAATLTNMRKDLAGGGVLMDLGSHMLDLLLFLFDGPAEVKEYRDDCLGGVEASCELRLRLFHGGKALEGSVELSRTRKLGSYIRLQCERGSLEFQISDPYRVKVLPFDLELVDALPKALRPYHLQGSWATESETAWWGYEAYRAEIDDWLGAIRSGQPPELSGESGLPTVRLVEDCYRSRQPLEEPWVGPVVSCQSSVVSRGSNGQPASIVNRQLSPANSKRRVLVTGATGFIGCRVAEVLSLRDGWQVRALVHNPNHASRLARLPVEMVQADLSSERDLQRLVDDCDAVVHCAVGTVWGDRRKNFAVNVEGTRRLAEAALAAGVNRFVHFSTISVYGDDSAMTGILDESTPLRPMRRSDYGETKAAAEREIENIATKGLNACILRPARVFGPFSRIFIINPLEAMAAGGFRWLGSPDVPCDMVYVDNVVTAVLQALDAPDRKVRGEVFNISDGDPMTWREFYQFFAEGLGLNLSNVPVDRLPLTGRREIARSVLGWPIDFFSGVNQIITSREFKSLGRRFLETNPVGTFPRWLLARFPGIERTVRKIANADGSLPLYRREKPMTECLCHMGSGGALVNIEKARRLLGYEPVVPRDRAMELTLEWVRHARLV